MSQSLYSKLIVYQDAGTLEFDVSDWTQSEIDRKVEEFKREKIEDFRRKDFLQKFNKEATFSEFVDTQSRVFMKLVFSEESQRKIQELKASSDCQESAK